MTHFDELMQRALTVRNNVAPSSNTATLVGGVLVSIVSALQLLLNTKQGTLTFDNEPTDGSTNPVTSDGIYQALQAIDLSACEKIVNKVTSINAQSTNVQYPTAKLLYDSLQALSGIYAAIVHTHVAADITDLSTVLSVYELLSNKVAAVDAQSTDDQYPTAKLLYDSLQIVDAYLNNLDARVTSLENDPPIVYTIRGTSSNIGGTETFRLQLIAKGATTPTPQQSITVDVDGSGNWSYKYVNKQIYSLAVFAKNNTTLLTIDFTDADDLTKLVYCGTNISNGAFVGATSLKSVTFGTQRLSALENATNMFKDCSALTSIDMHNATLDSLVTGYDMFNGCTALTSIDLSAAILSSLENGAGMFNNCTSITSINLHSATFASLKSMRQMFRNDSILRVLDITSASFDNVTDAYWAFHTCRALPGLTLAGTFAQCTTMLGCFRNLGRDVANVVISLPDATFASLNNAEGIFGYCTTAKKIEMPSALCSAVGTSTDMFVRCDALSEVTVPGGSSAILPTSTPASAPLDLRSSPLTYASMLNVANWLSDLTGYTAHTVTFNTTAWNALTAAEQATILGILQAKNWNLATA